MIRYQIVKELTNDLGQKKVVLGNGSDFFVMTCWPDGTYTRPAENGLTVKTSDFDYAAIGAKKSQTVDQAINECRNS